MTTRPHPKTFGLAGVLWALIVRAERAHDGAFKSAPLKGGLTVAVRTGAQFTLHLSRDGERWPGKVEWRTCVQSLPEAYKPASPLEPSEWSENGRNYAGATWPLAQKKLL